ncbi:hypothetical protein [Pseudaestuariivita rosea]|uniref:hypothetical protein n=1 Tax=Pseudaestuariivita rosea TaxID=2763263 RepID=UPI001ABB7613|nr:hypothetical protein [Pseudaestuariivita rosea]
MPTTKVVKCCYCGTKAALVLKGRERHELACSACGAPLHDLKIMPMGHQGKKMKPQPAHPRKYAKNNWEQPRRRKKKRKSLASRILDEAFDIVEDIFD